MRPAKTEPGARVTQVESGPQDLNLNPILRQSIVSPVVASIVICAALQMRCILAASNGLNPP